MLERARLFEGLDLVHGFTTRCGGVSRGRHASLNVGGKWGDDPAAVAENRRRVAERAGFSLDELRMVRQVHGRTVLRATQLRSDSEADALSVHRGEGPMVVAVMTADCVPVLLADRSATVACAIHSGWRGTVANIVGEAVRILTNAGIDPADLIAAIGPCIERDAFEVGPEVAAQFDEAHVVREGFERPHVDLVAACRARLLDAGLPETSIERVGGCTHTTADRYFSYRRDGAGTGQMMSFIGFPGRS